MQAQIETGGKKKIIISNLLLYLQHCAIYLKKIIRSHQNCNLVLALKIRFKGEGRKECTTVEDLTACQREQRCAGQLARVTRNALGSFNTLVTSRREAETEPANIATIHQLQVRYRRCCSISESMIKAGFPGSPSWPSATAGTGAPCITSACSAHKLSEKKKKKTMAMI